MQPDSRAHEGADALTGLGAVEVTPPRPELPDVLVATVDEQQHPSAEWASVARQLPGVAGARSTSSAGACDPGPGPCR